MTHSARSMLFAHQWAHFDLQGLPVGRNWTERGYLETSRALHIRHAFPLVSSFPCGRGLKAWRPSRTHVELGVTGLGQSRAARQTPVSVGSFDRTLMRRTAADSSDSKAPRASPFERTEFNLHNIARQVQCSGVPVDSSDPSSGTDVNATETSRAGQELGPDGRPKRIYKDSSFDLAFIQVCRQAYGKLAQWQSPRNYEDGYRGMVDVSLALMRSRPNVKEQRAAILQGFPKVPQWFRKAFPYSKWGAELNARITPTFFTWLVGPMEIFEVEIDGVLQRSGVQIERCRYLEESGCTGMCVNLCKFPTQTFFTEELGMPLSMEPKFEDLSCQMIFGKKPPAIEDDEVMKQPCFASCPTANVQAPACPKVR